MPSIEALLAFTVAAIILIAIPGPSVLFSVARALELGRGGGLASVAGNTLGSFTIAMLVAFGVGAIIVKSVVVFTVIKFLGAGYIIYLGIQGIRQRKDRSPTDGGTYAQASYLRLFTSGWIVGATNPKSLMFFIAVLPQFVNTQAGSVPTQLVVFASVFTLIALISDALWVFAAAAARNWFASSPGRLDMLKGVGGGMLVALGGTMLFASNRAA